MNEQVRDGWRLVPARPTPEMLKAVDDEAEEKYLARGRAVSAWALMLNASPLAKYPVEPEVWLDPASGEKCSTISATLKRYNELAGGAPASVASKYSEPLFRNPAMDGRWYSADDIDNLVYELDVLFNGEEDAADQAKLCDLVAQLSAEYGVPNRYMGANSVEGIVSDEELDRAYANADFGNMTKREVVRLGVLKCISGWHQGHTSEMICRELGLISPQYRVTAKGRMYSWYANKGMGDV